MKGDLPSVDLAAPTYDCDAAMTALFKGPHPVEPRLWPFADRAIRLAHEGFLIPHRAIVLMMDIPRIYNDGTILTGEWVIHIEAINLAPVEADLDAPLSWIASLFDREVDDQGRFARYSGAEWSCTRFLYLRQHFAVEADGPKFVRVEDHPEQAIMRHTDLLIRTMLGLIQTEPTFVAAPSSREHQAASAGRVRGKFAPLPMVRVLQVDRSLYERVAREHATTGREMPPHYRRPSMRTYRHPRFVNMQGQTRPIAEAFIRADKDKASQPIYHVRLSQGQRSPPQ